MMNFRAGNVIGIVVLSCLMSVTAWAAIDLPSVISDNMVLQRNRAVPIWGQAKVGEQVAVSFRGRTVSTTAGADGKWRVDIPAGRAGGPFELTIAGEDTVTLKNILVGEVWVCSGQSNMQMTVQSVRNAQEEIARAEYPEIRFFTVPNVASAKPQDDCQGSWSACSPQTVPGFSAVGYFFGRDMHKHLKVPVGLINTSWGGTNAETWTPREIFMTVPEFSHFKEMILAADKPVDKSAYLKKVSEWEQATHRADPGNTGFAKGWADPDFAAAEWKQAALPGSIDKFDGQSNFDGVVWFRKEVTVPESWAGRDLVLCLGGIDDFDVTYFNGVKVGSTGQDVECHWSVPRKYTVPGSCVKAGRNVIAVRMFDNCDFGGFVGAAEGMKLCLAGQEASIPLAGTWQYQIEAEIHPINPQLGEPGMPAPLGQVNTPCALYNAMIHPLLPFAIQGVIWYQGEANAWRAYEYRTLFPSMIRGWREAWGQGDFPFLFVQLANFMDVNPEPGESGWAELREAQTMTLTASPNTGMAVIIDIGEAKDIHPRNKQDVGKRLGLAARGKAYGENITYSGPVYDSMSIQGDKAVVKFRYVDGGLVARDGEALKGFAVAGADGKFVWAEARIEGDTVIVWSDQVKSPVAVRYAWADNPICNLYNKAGLPASPFRTDVK